MRRVLVRVLACICGLACALPAPAASQAALTAQAVPGTTDLAGIACPLRIVCVAVGSVPGTPGIATPVVVPVIRGAPGAA